MASKQSWRLEDLHEHQDIGLAEELESGLYLSEFGSDSMKEIIQSLISEDDKPFYSPPTDDHITPNTSFSSFFNEPSTNILHSSPQTTPTKITPDTSGFTSILNVPTACTVKTDIPTVTYLNRGQIYQISLSSTTHQIYKSTLSLEFYDLRLRNYEQQHLEEWMQCHQGEKMVDIDQMSCDNISEITYSDINRVEFAWSSHHDTVVSFKVNCLSSEFTQKKHGGEKGVLLRLIITHNEGIEDGNSVVIYRAFCLIKVFKDKGADRKHRQDILRREKLPLQEAVKYWESKPVTVLESILQSNSPFKSKTENKSIPSPQYTMCSPSASVQSPQSTNQMPETSTHHMTSLGVDESHQWLINNRFAPYISLFANYTGSDFLRLSRKDLMDLCGPADGIRLYNALHSRSMKTIYICLEEDSVYQCIFLEKMTATHFKDKLSIRLCVSASAISSVVLLHNTGILVNVDDICIQNMNNEECFILQPVKEEQGTYRLILKPPNIPQFSVQGMSPRIN